MTYKQNSSTFCIKSKLPFPISYTRVLFATLRPFYKLSVQSQFISVDQEMEINSETFVLQSSTRAGVLGQVGMLWDLAKAPLIVPVLRLMVNVCLAMSVMLFVERVYMGIVKLFIQVLRRTPKKKFKWEAMKEDLELGSLAYPMVLVQIPMYNEKEVVSLILLHIEFEFLSFLHFFCYYYQIIKSFC